MTGFITYLILNIIDVVFQLRPSESVVSSDHCAALAAARRRLPVPLHEAARRRSLSCVRVRAPSVGGWAEDVFAKDDSASTEEVVSHDLLGDLFSSDGGGAPPTASTAAEFVFPGDDESRIGSSSGDGGGGAAQNAVDTIYDLASMFSGAGAGAAGGGGGGGGASAKVSAASKYKPKRDPRRPPDAFDSVLDSAWSTMEEQGGEPSESETPGAEENVVAPSTTALQTEDGLSLSLFSENVFGAAATSASGSSDLFSENVFDNAASSTTGGGAIGGGAAMNLFSDDVFGSDAAAAAATATTAGFDLFSEDVFAQTSQSESSPPQSQTSPPHGSADLFSEDVFGTANAVTTPPSRPSILATNVSNAANNADDEAAWGEDPFATPHAEGKALSDNLFSEDVFGQPPTGAGAGAGAEGEATFDESAWGEDVFG